MTTFLDNALNKEIVGLLAASELPVLEKQVWLSLLPDMTEDEKLRLKANLVEEAEYEIKVTEDVIKKFRNASDVA